MPDLPSIHAIAALVITFITFTLFATNRIRIELVCLLLIAVLALGFYLFPFVQEGRFTGMEVAFGGFGHEALVAICCLMIIARGLLVTGALEPAARALSQLWRVSSSLGLLSSILICTGLSMFVNDTPVLVLTLPILLSLAARSGTPASKTLMPVNFAILIGGMGTTIGTSTNLLVVSIASDLGQPPIGVFDFTPLVLTACVVAVPYLWLVMPRLLPAVDNTTRAAKRVYEGVLHRAGTAPRTEKTVLQVAQRLRGTARLVGIVRHGTVMRNVDERMELAPADHLLISGTLDELREASELLRAPLAEPSVIDHVRRLAEQASQDQRIAELVIGSESTLIGQTVKSARIADRYGVAVLGTTRAETMPFRERASPDTEELSVGDVLLVQGTPDRLITLELGEGALLLEGGLDLPHSAKATVALLITGGVVLLAAFKVLPVAIAALAGTIAMLATGCVRFEGIGRALNLEVIVLVASSIALGRALVETGAAEWLGSMFAFAFGSFPPAVILATLMIFTTILTNFVSNAAAAGVTTPLAISLAEQLGTPSEPYVLAVLFGCNLCYVTPMAYQTNLLIMSAARYRFSDFVRAGFPLAVLMVLVLAYLLVREYQL